MPLLLYVCQWRRKQIERKGGGGLDIKNLHQQKKSFGYGYV